MYYQLKMRHIETFRIMQTSADAWSVCEMQAQRSLEFLYVGDWV